MRCIPFARFSENMSSHRVSHDARNVLASEARPVRDLIKRGFLAHWYRCGEAKVVESMDSNKICMLISVSSVRRLFVADILGMSASAGIMQVLEPKLEVQS
jgi:hypothetical protein